MRENTLKAVIVILQIIDFTDFKIGTRVAFPDMPGL